MLTETKNNLDDANNKIQSYEKELSNNRVNIRDLNRELDIERDKLKQLQKLNSESLIK